MYTEKMKRSLKSYGFTRRHYEFIADVLNEMHGVEVKGSQYRLICEKFADRMTQASSRFDKARFLNACGV